MEHLNSFLACCNKDDSQAILNTVESDDRMKNLIVHGHSGGRNRFKVVVVLMHFLDKAYSYMDLSNRRAMKIIGIISMVPL